MDDFEVVKARNAQLARGERYFQMAADARRIGDARQYADLCDRYGLPHDDEDLYQRGQVEMRDRKKIVHQGVEKLVANGPTSNFDVYRLGDYWAPIARVVLADFGTKQEGEHIGLQEYRDRFRQLKKLGYPVPSGWNTMSFGQIRVYFKNIREDVRKNAKTYCLPVVKEISADNSGRRTEYCP
ncbi:MAG: hypothetical protein Q8L29_01020 [archaeon]|nr:hypothetical protein [archaeon]